MSADDLKKQLAEMQAMMKRQQEIIDKLLQVKAVEEPKITRKEHPIEEEPKSVRSNRTYYVVVPKLQEYLVINDIKDKSKAEDYLHTKGVKGNDLNDITIGYNFEQVKIDAPGYAEINFS
jgi:hypothetical protein